MAEKKITDEVLKSLYKNANVAILSISDVSPETEDLELKKELLDEYDGYQRISHELKSYMQDVHVEPIEINAMKKAMMWSSIKMNTLMDKGRNHIADMMLQGTNMGIVELTTIKNESMDIVDDRTGELLEELLSFEENNIERLKTFL